MKEFTFVHKHCGMTKLVEAENLYQAIKENNLDTKVWECVVR